MPDRSPRSNFPALATVSVVLGVAASVATNWFLNRHPGPGAAPASGAAERSVEKTVREFQIVHDTNDTQMSELEARIAELEKKKGPSPEERSGPPPMSHEEEDKMLTERFAGLDRNFRQDPVDPKWAPSSERALAEGLAAPAAKAGFSIVRTECKTEACRATVEFKNFDEARTKGLILPQLDFPGLNCAEQIWVPEPENPSAPYQTQLYLDCSAQRRGEAEPIAQKGK